MLNKQKGNMYGFVEATFNTVKGKCPHDCSYCYMKRWGPQPELHFDESELKTDLYKYGENRFIFVGSSCDMWAFDCPSFNTSLIKGAWVYATIMHCQKFPKNKYLLQSKAPQCILYWIGYLRKNFTIATTIETNRAYPEMGKAPPIGERIRALREIKDQGFETMITIEPIMDFDFAELTNWIYEARPDQVNIGADSQGHNLPEPTPGKIKALIVMLSQFTRVTQKPNLKRLMHMGHGA
ncbi:hypothetical protein LCGC14_0944760 [marine sediment metagenome]|uniref:Radical SAM core domain-containing protein n=1 Tax=marine sediment metagenome TaxID=412755 RepID=A0A0F9R2L5_9ZZZZ